MRLRTSGWQSIRTGALPAIISSIILRQGLSSAACRPSWRYSRSLSSRHHAEWPLIPNLFVWAWDVYENQQMGFAESIELFSVHLASWYSVAPTHVSIAHTPSGEASCRRQFVLAMTIRQGQQSGHSISSVTRECSNSLVKPPTLDTTNQVTALYGGAWQVGYRLQHQPVSPRNARIPAHIVGQIAVFNLRTLVVRNGVNHPVRRFCCQIQTRRLVASRHDAFLAETGMVVPVTSRISAIAAVALALWA